MSNVFSFNNVKKAAALVLIILLVTALVPAPVQAAEAKWYKGYPGSKWEPVKIGDGYFWTDYSDIGHALYYSAEAYGEGVKLADMDKYKYDLGISILYNGSKVYYTSYNWKVNDYEYLDNTVIRIHSVSKNGKNNKVLKTFKVKDMSPIPDLLSVYNGRIFFQRYSDEEYTLSSMNMEKNKDGKYLVSNHVKGVWGQKISANGRYIYCKNQEDHYVSSETAVDVKVFDCKEKKVVRTLKNVKGFALTDKHVWFYKYDSNTEKNILYRTSLDGKSNKEKMMTFGKNKEWTYGAKTASKMYCFVRDDKTVKYYEFDISKGTKKEISESAYISNAAGGTLGM